MIFTYQFPTVYVDQEPVGSLAKAFRAYPDHANQILQAHGIAWASAAALSEVWQQSDAAKAAEIAELKTKLAPAICEITPALLDAGLLAWGQDAVSAVDSEQGAAVMGLVMDLKMAAIESPSIGQCQQIKNIFGMIMHLSKVQPTHDQAAAMQAVLDAGCPSTGPVAAEYLSFAPWIKREG